MNCLAICSVLFCGSLFLTVDSRHSEKYCDSVETDDGLKIITDCLDQHLPSSIITLISRCYEVGFNEPGSTASYLRKFCQAAQYEEQISDTLHCLRERDDDVLKESGITEGELRESAMRAEECWVSKLPATSDDTSNELEEAIEDADE